MIILGLGSNVGDRENYLKTALQELSASSLTIIKQSPIYESKALVANGANKEWENMPYLNMAVIVESDHKIDPYALLRIVKNIEKKIGRDYRGFWGPREIDIDILAYDDLVLQDENLTIPHKELCERNFAIFPFADIAPNWICPLPGTYYTKKACEIRELLNKEGIELWNKGTSK